MMITTRRQNQAIADLIGDKTPALKYEDLDRDHQWLWSEIENYEDPYEAQQHLYRLKELSEDNHLKELITNIKDMQPGQSIQLESLSDIRPTLKPVEFFWDNWIPYGYITALVGWPAIGKSYIALDLAYRLEKHLPAPDGQPFNTRNGKVLFVDAEDFITGINERAEAWGMTGHQFYVLRSDTMINLNTQFFKDLLVDMMFDIQPDLLIIDSFSMVQDSQEQGVSDVREIMRFLNQIAKAFNCGLLIIFHPRKPKDQTMPITMYDLRGSGFILFVVRSILGMELQPTPDQDPNSPRILRTLKNNFGPYPPPLKVGFQSLTQRVAKLTYTTLTSTQPNSLQTETDQCRTWLIDYLSSGPKTYTDISQAADTAGYSTATLQRARSSAAGLIKNTIGPKMKGNKLYIDKIDED
jgi:DNA replication protein DnaC